MVDEEQRRAEYLSRVSVGEPVALDSTVVLLPYDPAWPGLFARHAARVRAALGMRVLQLEHVGSTSVPGLAAKPIIDMLLAVADAADEAAYVPLLQDCGCVLRIREPHWFEHRMLEMPDGAGNLHVFSQGCAEITRMLAFRDWLRSHDADRQRYEACKRSLAARTWRYMQDYADEKSAVVAEILARMGSVP